MDPQYQQLLLEINTLEQELAATKSKLETPDYESFSASLADPTFLRESLVLYRFTCLHIYSVY